jgi:PAS domain S-box-containing protein
VIVQERSDKPGTLKIQRVKKRILLVEDNIADARLIREMLHEAGSDRDVLETASRLSEALLLARKAPFDIVLLDLGLPDSQGLETLTTYLESASEIPVIVLTGLADDAISVQAVECGAQDYLVKGRIDGPMLFRAIRYAIGRKRQEGVLRQNEERYRAVTHSATDAIISADSAGNIVHWNQGAETIFGYSGAEVIGQPATLLMPSCFQEGHLAGMARMRAGGESHVLGKVVEMEGVRKDGSKCPVELSLSAWLVDDLRYYTAIIRDVTERKRAEEEKGKLQAQLQQAMKMEAVGRLAGGVAHDFNNLLTVITGYSELLLQKIGKESPMHGEVEQIQRAGERAALLTRQLLAFSRKQIIEPKVLDLNLLTVDVGKMLVRLIGENIDLKTVPGKNVGKVKVDSGHFEQVLINLAVNARDAMPDGGSLLIETANVELDEAYCAQRPYQIAPGRYVMLAVSDTGCGMTGETSKHIFEPFFTTKATGQGTGLGLSMIYGAVKQAGGSIEVYSEVGKGTTVKIYLPRVEGETVEQEKDDQPTVLLGGTETVLLTEDEEIVRKMCFRILGDLGYKVLQAGNGAEAIALAHGYGDRIDLLLTDVVMPGMNGAELARQLVVRHPEMKVLFTSGYTHDAISRHGVLDEGVSFIGKPYTPSALARKVRKVLDKG